MNILKSTETMNRLKGIKSVNERLESMPKVCTDYVISMTDMLKVKTLIDDKYEFFDELNTIEDTDMLFTATRRYLIALNEYLSDVRVIINSLPKTPEIIELSCTILKIHIVLHSYVDEVLNTKEGIFIEELSNYLTTLEREEFVKLVKTELEDYFGEIENIRILDVPVYYKLCTNRDIIDRVHEVFNQIKNKIVTQLIPSLRVRHAPYGCDMSTFDLNGYIERIQTM